MSDKLTFIGKPCPKPRMTRADAWKKRPVVLAYWAFKDEINRQADEQGFELGEAHRVTFYIEIPKSWSQKKKIQMENEPHKSRPDLDNLCKALWDSVLQEDSACHYVVANKKWSVTPKIIVENYPDTLGF